MAVHTRPRVTAVAIQALRAAVDILLAAGAAAIPRVEGADIPPVAAAIPVEAITKPYERVAVNEVKNRGEKGRAKRHALFLWM